MGTATIEFVKSTAWPFDPPDDKRVTWTLKSKHLDGLAIDAVVYKDGLPWWKA